RAVQSTSMGDSTNRLRNKERSYTRQNVSVTARFSTPRIHRAWFAALEKTIRFSRGGSLFLQARRPVQDNCDGKGRRGTGLCIDQKPLAVPTRDIVRAKRHDSCGRLCLK